MIRATMTGSSLTLPDHIITSSHHHIITSSRRSRRLGLLEVAPALLLTQGAPDEELFAQGVEEAAIHPLPVGDIPAHPVDGDPDLEDILHIGRDGIQSDLLADPQVERRQPRLQADLVSLAPLSLRL